MFVLGLGKLGVHAYEEGNTCVELGEDEGCLLNDVKELLRAKNLLGDRSMKIMPELMGIGTCVLLNPLGLNRLNRVGLLESGELLANH